MSLVRPGVATSRTYVTRQPAFTTLVRGLRCGSQSWNRWGVDVLKCSQTIPAGTVRGCRLNGECDFCHIVSENLLTCDGSSESMTRAGRCNLRAYVTPARRCNLPAPYVPIRPGVCNLRTYVHTARRCNLRTYVTRPGVATSAPVSPGQALQPPAFSVTRPGVEHGPRRTPYVTRPGVAAPPAPLCPPRPQALQPPHLCHTARRCTASATSVTRPGVAQPPPLCHTGPGVAVNLRPYVTPAPAFATSRPCPATRPRGATSAPFMAPMSLHL